MTTRRDQDDDATRLRCPALGIDAQLTDERQRHIAERHPDLLPELVDRIATTLADPDTIRSSRRMPTARLVARWFDDLRNGKHVVVVVVLPEPGQARAWIVTAYMARALAPGDVLWTRPS